MRCESVLVSAPEMFHERFWLWFLITYAAVTSFPGRLLIFVTHGPFSAPSVVTHAGTTPGMTTHRGRLSTPAYAESAAGRLALMYTGAFRSRLYSASSVPTRPHGRRRSIPMFVRQVCGNRKLASVTSSS